MRLISTISGGGGGDAGSSVIYGEGPPADSVGDDGDSYLDTLNLRLYGPRTSGRWETSYVDLLGGSGVVASHVGPDALTRVGQVIPLGGSGDFDEALVESPVVFWDPPAGRWGMVYVGYSAGGLNASVGLAWSDDLLTWEKDDNAPILERSGTVGAPDKEGMTGPTIFYENGTYYLFYIGNTATGYEGGSHSICLATATSIYGPWTRHGAKISPSGSGWRNTAIWHPNVVKRDDTYYLFFNANGTKEQIGYATSPDLLTWTVDDANSPVLTSGAAGQWDPVNVIDPWVYRIDDVWYMEYGASGRDGIAYTTNEGFPLGWTKYPYNPILSASGAGFDKDYAVKPCAVIHDGVYYHFYTGIIDTGDVRTIGVATQRVADTPLTTVRSSDIERRALRQHLVASYSTAAQEVLRVGTGSAFATTGTGRAKVVLASDTIAELLLVTANNRALIFSFDSAQAAKVETYAGTDPLQIQNNAGDLRLGGTGGKVGLLGASPVSRPTVTGSRGGNAALASLLTALASLGLITDSTSA